MGRDTAVESNWNDTISDAGVTDYDTAIMTIDIDTALAPIGEFEARSRDFAAFWFSLPKIDLIPRREAFKPEQIPHLLPNLVIHEILSPELIRLRLSGTAVDHHYGQTVTGRNYLDFVEPERRPAASRAIRKICEHPAGMLVHLRSATVSGRIQTRESIAFPMRDSDGRATLVYFCSGNARERSNDSAPQDALKVMEVMRRQYIDIGAGLPEIEG